LTVVSGPYQHAQSDCLRWPEVLRPVRGELRVTGKSLLSHSRTILAEPTADLPAFDTVFADCMSYHNGHGQAYQGYGIDENVGCIVVIRPDQYVAQVVRMDEYEQIGRYLASSTCSPCADSGHNGQAISSVASCYRRNDLNPPCVLMKLLLSLSRTLVLI
jgi:hypothetical protein